MHFPALSALRSLAALALLPLGAQVAFAASADCYRDIRKDISATPPVVHDFGCPSTSCDTPPATCQAFHTTFGGVTHYGCTCQPLGSLICVLMYADTGFNSDDDGGGSGGSATCVRFLCAKPCEGGSTYDPTGDPEVRKARNDCSCP